MFTPFKKSLIAATMAVIGATAILPAAAHADSYLGLGGGRSGPSVEFFIGDDGREFGRDDRRERREDWRRERREEWRRDNDWRREDWRRDRYEEGRSFRRERGCNPDYALMKAERMGVRRARIVDIDRRSIDIVGRSRGDRVFLTFARAPGCPLIRG